MAQEFSSILTVRGRQKLAASLAGGPPLKLAQIAVGDGRNGTYYSPTETQVMLENEKFRGPINDLYQDPINAAWAVVELVIPDEIGDFYVREVGVFDVDGELITIGKFPESYKPVLAAGAGKQLYVRQILEVSNTSAITLVIDPSLVTATRQFVEGKIGSVVDQFTDRFDRLDAKNSVRSATTAPITLSGLQAVDGISLAAGNRILVKDQAAAQENGIYIVSAGVWARAQDADTSIKVSPGMFVTVEEGTKNGGSMWQLITAAPIVLNTTALSWKMAAGRTGIVAGIYNGLTVDDRGRVIDAESIRVCVGIRKTARVGRKRNIKSISGFCADASV